VPVSEAGFDWCGAVWFNEDLEEIAMRKKIKTG
jgi:hypothetical protein